VSQIWIVCDFFFLELHACTGMRTKRMTDVGLQTDMDQCLGRWNIGRTSTEVYDSHPISPALLGLSISLRQRDDSRISSISCERINLLNFALDKFIFIASTSTICGDACPLSCASADRGLQVGPMHETAEMGKLINAALLSLLMRRVWVYAVLPASWVNSSVLLVCRHDRVTREVGRVGLVGRDRGRRGIEWRCTCIFILPGF